MGGTAVEGAPRPREGGRPVKKLALPPAKHVFPWPIEANRTDRQKVPENVLDIGRDD